MQPQQREPNTTLAYAVETFNGGTGLYSDLERRRFVAVIYRRLAEGEVVQGATYYDRHRVTWAAGEQASQVAA